MAREKKDGHRINYYIDRRVYEQLKRYADEKGQSVTTAIERILNEHLFENAQSIAAISDVTQVQNEKERLQNWLDSLPCASVSYNAYADGSISIRLFNETLCRMVGCTKREYADRSAINPMVFVCEEDIPLLRDAVEQIIKGQPKYSCEYRLVTKNGIIWVHLDAVVHVRNADYTTVLTAFTDITKRKETERLIALSRYYQDLYDTSLSAGTIINSLDFTTPPEHIAENLPKMLGMTMTEFKQEVGNAYRNIIHPDDYERVIDLNTEYGKHPRDSYEMEFRFVKKDGSVIWVLEKAKLTESASGYPAYISVFTDITAQKKTEDDLRIANEEINVALSKMGKMLCSYDVASRTLIVPKAYAEMHGSLETVCVPNDNIPDSSPEKPLQVYFHQIIQGEKSGEAVMHFQYVDGTGHWERMEYVTFFNSDNEPTRALISVEDITENYEKELTYKQQREAMDAIPDGEKLFVEVDLSDMKIVRSEGRLIADLQGLSETDTQDLGELADYCIHHYSLPDFWDAVRAFLTISRLKQNFDSGITYDEIEYVMQTEPELRWLRLTLNMVESPYTDHLIVLLMFRDITNEKVAELDVKNRAEIDGMTGIFNRATAEAMIKKHLEKVANEPCALLIADIDNLKRINDSMGHAQGDRAIKGMASILSDTFRFTDVVARIGGDEFIVFLPDINSAKLLKAKAYSVLRGLAATPLGENDEAILSGSIGIALGKAGETNYDSLLKRADRALYHVKRHGKNNFAFYTAEMEYDDYQLVENEAISIGSGTLPSGDELKNLLSGLAEIYPMLISVNLSRNRYYMLEYETYTAKSAPEYGIFDKLIDIGAQTFHPDDRQSFADAFSRDSLLAAYADGKKTITHKGRQLGDDNVYRMMETVVAFTQPVNGDICEITFARFVK